MQSSSADQGFFQEPPVLVNQFEDDVSFGRCFRLFLPAHVRAAAEAEVAALGQDVLADDVLAWISDAERNEPYMRGDGRDVFGRPAVELVTTEGWRKLRDFGIAKGQVACLLVRVKRLPNVASAAASSPVAMIRPSCANTGCPGAMQDGAASLLRKHLKTQSLSANQRHAMEDALTRLTSRNPASAWTSGQWMTERPGGSDVSQTETTAVPVRSPDDESLGPWAIHGFKWFASATDSDMAVLLARTSAGGLSAFFAPMRRHDAMARTKAGSPLADGSRLNGVRISRLKRKFGTRSLPTAELVLDGMRAWLIGDEGQGVRAMGAVLALTRIHSAVGAVGGIGRGLAVARAYARVRVVSGDGDGQSRIRLAEKPLHMRTLARMTAEYHGLMLLSFFAAYVLGLAENPLAAPLTTGPLAAMTPELELAEPLLRVLTQLTKAYVCKASVPLMFACMESLGGIGYLSTDGPVDLGRIFRDLCVGPIWEGTTDVLCADFVRALRRPGSGGRSLAALDEVVARAAAAAAGGGQDAEMPRPSDWQPAQRWASVRARILDAPQADAAAQARELVWEVAEVLVSLLLYVDAGSDDDPVAVDVLRRFLEAKQWVSPRARGTWREELARDSAIVYGVEGGSNLASKL
ncbi:hypothetical protein L249_1416 [Ophiocordyceps polyrhachis-furcata BCC 54312]|uniref:Acyl-CoA dehydrogenase/oxidase C-terminal domain-containing protein n=1 Tax=Ophiocordyceps polyrhachis-furcata BCC 54312 TaxID=1330021 RepID=A0A367L4J4_9HYPO|nr:hypothetical protein L249_1416 [Ophiocordyceps polyrhachis-furcata BCC 54312]